jgi:hypothetical protein
MILFKINQTQYHLPSSIAFARVVERKGGIREEVKKGVVANFT